MYDWLAPRFLISVEGTKLQSDVSDFVRAVTYEEGDEVASRIALEVANPNFVFNESKVFAEGNKIDLWMGYLGKKLTFMNRCEVVKPNPTFPRDGMPMFNVEAFGAEHRLMVDEPTGKTYEKYLDSEIAEWIFNHFGIAPFTFATKPRHSRVRRKGTPFWEFLERLARLNGYVVEVRYDQDVGGNVGYFGPSQQTPEDQYTFSYGTGETDATLLEFYPDFSLPSAKTKVMVEWTEGRGRDRKHRKVEIEVDSADAEKVRYKGASGADKIRQEVRNGPAVRYTVFGQSEEVIVGRQFKSAAEAKRFAAAWWARREQEFIFGRGVVLGTPSLRKGQVHTLRLPDVRLSGQWRLTSVAHRMSPDGPYETEFTATKVVLGSKVGNAVSPSSARLKEVEQ